MEIHCVNMELKYQNQALKDGQHGQILNETINKAKINKEIEVLETINIELEHSVAKLLAKNEKLHKENEHLKQTYKDLYDSIKKTRITLGILVLSLTSNTLCAQLVKSVSLMQINDAYITKFLKEVNSRAKIQPNKTRNSNKAVDPTSHNQKPGRKIVTGHTFSPNKSSIVHEKTNTPRSCLRWIPTGRNFNTTGLKWVPTGKTFTSSTTTVDCDPPNGSNECITNPYKCDQTLNVSASTLNLNASTFCNPKKERLGTTLQAPFLKEKKGVRFSALYLQKKRNLLVFDHSHQQ
ncbi:hypothetical protein Tco_0086053 [Tanacetum coccineum]